MVSPGGYQFMKQKKGGGSYWTENLFVVGAAQHACIAFLPGSNLGGLGNKGKFGKSEFASWLPQNLTTSLPLVLASSRCSSCDKQGHQSMLILDLLSTGLLNKKKMGGLGGLSGLKGKRRAATALHGHKQL